MGGSFGLVLLGGVTALGAVLIAAMVMPTALPASVTKAPSRRLLDFRPVLRNRAAMGWIIGYTVHTWELSALRAWGVTFLTVVCASQGAPSWLPDPTVLFTLVGLARADYPIPATLRSLVSPAVGKLSSRAEIGL